MTPIDMVSVLKDAPLGEWICLNFERNRVVSHAPNLQDAIAAANELGENQPVVLKVPPPHMLIL